MLKKVLLRARANNNNILPFDFRLQIWQHEQTLLTLAAFNNEKTLIITLQTLNI